MKEQIYKKMVIKSKLQSDILQIGSMYLTKGLQGFIYLSRINGGINLKTRKKLSYIKYTRKVNIFNGFHA